MIFGESAFFAQEPIGCAINDKWNSRHGRGVQTEPPCGRHGTPHSLPSTVGMRKNTRAWVWHEGLAQPRCEGVDNHVQDELLGCSRQPLTHSVEADGMLEERPSTSEPQKLEVTPRPRLQET